MSRPASLSCALALLLVSALAPEPAAACSIWVERELSPGEKRRDAGQRIERSTAIIDGEVVRPFRRGGAPALVRAHRILKGPKQEFFAVGERSSCDRALEEVGARFRMIFNGGPDIYYVGLDVTDDRHEDRLLGSDRRKVWLFRQGTAAPPGPPAAMPPSGASAPPIDPRPE